jgi:hypothetical protein
MLYSQIHPGMVISTMFWADSARGGKPSDKGKGIQCTADCNVIKAFTLMEVELVCKVGVVHLFANKVSPCMLLMWI